jgi:hypothetical protein
MSTSSVQWSPSPQVMAAAGGGHGRRTRDARAWRVCLQLRQPSRTLARGHVGRLSLTGSSTPAQVNDESELVPACSQSALP